LRKLFWRGGGRRTGKERKKEFKAEEERLHRGHRERRGRREEKENGI
jgi:hypothetical protein